jgi:hypothetical protein
MSKAAQGFSLRRTDRTPQTAFSQAAERRSSEKGPFMDGHQLVSNNKTKKTPNLHICIGVAIRHKDGWKVMSGAILRNENLTGQG